VRIWVGYVLGDGGRSAFLLSGVVICWCRMIDWITARGERAGRAIYRVLFLFWRSRTMRMMGEGFYTFSMFCAVWNLVSRAACYSLLMHPHYVCLR